MIYVIMEIMSKLRDSDETITEKKICIMHLVGIMWDICAKWLLKYLSN